VESEDAALSERVIYTGNVYDTIQLFFIASHMQWGRADSMFARKYKLNYIIYVISVI